MKAKKLYLYFCDFAGRAVLFSNIFTSILFFYHQIFLSKECNYFKRKSIKNQIEACFVHYLKLATHFWKILCDPRPASVTCRPGLLMVDDTNWHLTLTPSKQIVWETYEWHCNFSRLNGSWVKMKTIFWWITQTPFDLLNLYFWVSQIIASR